MRNYIIFAIPAFFLFIAIEWMVARFKHRDVYRLNDSISDLSCGISQQIVSAFSRTFLLGVYVFFFTHWRWFDISIKAVWAWVVLFFVVDFLYYLFHRVSHRMNAPWAAHIVHHQSEEYNLSVALRQGSFQPFFSAIFYIPLAFLGFPPVMYMATRSINTLYQFWIHTRLVGKLGFFEWFLNTPSHHRVHHGKNPNYLDKNYAGILIIWDRMFGTFVEEKEEPVYGVTNQPQDFNPIWSNLYYWRDIYRSTKPFRQWWHKVIVWFMPPEWRPSYLEPYGPHPELDPKTYHKYDPSLPIGLKGYISLQFVVILGAALALLNYKPKLPDLPVYALTGFVLIGVLTMGGLLDRKRWALWLESLRLLLSAVLVGFLVSLYLPKQLLLYTSLFVAFGSASTLWLLRYRSILQAQAGRGLEHPLPILE